MKLHDSCPFYIGDREKPIAGPAVGHISIILLSHAYQVNCPKQLFPLMQHINVTQVFVVILLAIALIAFVIIRNRKDRKKLLKDDPVEGEIDEQQRKKDKL